MHGSANPLHSSETASLSRESAPLPAAGDGSPYSSAPGPSSLPFHSKTSAKLTQRSVLLVTAQGELRAGVAEQARLLRWKVRETGTGAGMFALLDEEPASAVLLDSVLPDLDVAECVEALAELFPQMDVLTFDGADVGARPARGSLRNELLHALRAVEQAHGQIEELSVYTRAHSSSEQRRRTSASAGDSNDGAASGCGPRVARATAAKRANEGMVEQAGACGRDSQDAHRETCKVPARVEDSARRSDAASKEIQSNARTVRAAAEDESLPEFIGRDPKILELSRRIRLVAHRKTSVLVHGPTGTGKELVARALHRLSGRANERFVAINCAAIPDALVEAELFGHARGAFTGAVQRRVGRIEAAAGGTLFLDEVGELPLAVQSKLLRFLESGEIQRVGENSMQRVDVRVVAATHRRLGAMAEAGTFRLDLLHRLSVFLIHTPALSGREADIDALIDHLLDRLTEADDTKQLTGEARTKLHAHAWPGNVRELEHTLERAWILAGTASEINAECIDFGESLA